MSRTTVAESSAQIRERVARARKIQEERFAEYNRNLPPELIGQGKVHCNAQMTPALMREYCKLDDAALHRLEKAMTKLGLSARAYDRILCVS